MGSWAKLQVSVGRFRMAKPAWGLSRAPAGRMVSCGRGFQLGLLLDFRIGLEGLIDEGSLDPAAARHWTPGPMPD